MGMWSQEGDPVLHAVFVQNVMRALVEPRPAYEAVTNPLSDEGVDLDALLVPHDLGTTGLRGGGIY